MLVSQISKSLLAFTTPNSNDVILMNINTGKAVKAKMVKARAKKN